MFTQKNSLQTYILHAEAVPLCRKTLSVFLHCVKNTAPHTTPLCDAGPAMMASWPGQELLSHLYSVGSNGWRQRYPVQGILEGISLLKVQGDPGCAGSPLSHWHYPTCSGPQAKCSWPRESSAILVLACSGEGSCYGIQKPPLQNLPGPSLTAKLGSHQETGKFPLTTFPIDLQNSN